MKSESYQLRWRGKVSGPFAFDTLKSMLARSEISLMHEVLQDGRWISLEELLAQPVPLTSGPEVSGDNETQLPPQPPPPPPPPPPPDEKYFVARGGDKEGPYHISRLRELARAGALGPDDSIWKDGMSCWVALSEILGPQAFRRPPGVTDPGSGATAGVRSEPEPKNLVRPECVFTAVVLLSVATSIGLARALIVFVAMADSDPFDKPAAVAIFFCALVAVFGFLFFLINQMGKGLNWARVTLLVLFILGLASTAFALPTLVKLPALLLVMDGAVMLLNLLAMIWAFMPDANRWFARVKARRFAELIK